MQHGLKTLLRPARIAKRSFEIASSPEFLLTAWNSDYLEKLGARGSFLARRPIDEHGRALPWMTYAAIQYFAQLDFSNAFVFEYGSGFGSLYWSARARNVVSIEHDRDWANEIRSKSNAGNHDLRLAGSKEAYVGAIHDVADVPDVVIIDGKYRKSCAQAVCDRLNGAGFIILDNSDWLPETCKYLSEQGFSQFDFVGPGPINRYAWATSVFVKGDGLRSLTRLGPAPKAAGGLDQLGDEG